MTSETYCTNKLCLNKSPADNIIVQTAWGTSNVRFKLLLPQNSESGSTTLGFTGKISVKDLKNTAADIEKSYEEFLKETKGALCTDNGLSDFLYECDRKTFSWRKTNESGFKLLYGRISLVPSNNLCFDMLLNTLDTVTDMKAKLTAASSDLRKLEEVHSQFAITFDKFIVEKQANEEQYLTKFAVLLNEKKRKIRELEKMIGNDKAVDINDNVEQSKRLAVRNIGKPSTSKSQSDPNFKLPKRKRTVLGQTAQSSKSATNLAPPPVIEENDTNAKEISSQDISRNGSDIPRTEPNVDEKLAKEQKAMADARMLLSQFTDETPNFMKAPYRSGVSDSSSAISAMETAKQILSQKHSIYDTETEDLFSKM